MNTQLLPPANPGIVWVSASATGTSDTDLLAGKPGLQFMITDLFICQSHATTGAGITLKGCSNGNLGPFPAASGFGGLVGKLNTPIPVAENTTLQFASSASTNVTVTIGGYWAQKGGY